MTKESKKAVLLLNVGTPDSTRVKDVRRYLREFLGDGRVIDIPPFSRWLLVNLIIAPFRAPKSAKLYRQLFTDRGSPLIYYTEDLVKKLNEIAPEGKRFFYAMRYQNPSLGKVLDEIRSNGFEQITVFPMFPQYASSTNGTAIQAVYEHVNTWQHIPEINTINQFYDHPGFIDAFAQRIEKYQPRQYDHIVFSYHGLPIRHVNKIHPDVSYESCDCSKSMPAHGNYCYRATSYQTSRLLAKRLGLTTEDYTVSFQSRLSDKWLKPFSDETLIRLAREGKKKVLIAAPSFVTDCLETIIELGYEYKELFTENGGEQLDMVESLNDMDTWARTIVELTR